MRRCCLTLALAFTLAPALTTLAGCSGASNAEELPPFQASARGQALELDNRSGRTVFYRAFDPELASRTRWAPCTETSRCDHLMPNAGAQLPLEDVPGYAPGAREVLVFWWFAVPDSLNAEGGEVADTVRTVTVAL